MKRINVVGTSASGKSTFSRKLAQKLNLAYIELDDLLWMDDWQETSDPEFFQKIKDAIADAEHHSDLQGYVIDGNYTRTVPLTWQEIDTVIWLDLPFALNLFQSIKRALSRAISKQPMWQHSNNTESFSRMLSRDSIILWMMKTHKKNRKKYQDRINHPDYAHIQFIHLRSRKEIESFLKQL
ncbi:AAA family ATPase [Acinetobacter sp. CFCC 10889]|uniref:AAA family ATPase n=1 Tax=Acinetobacter sp. CFCC 10889 TaxID=1775557 RepID=UPI000DD01960|nr:AAA family ATPase [Acinetobacter sp. CFCC 10889]